MRGCFEKYCFDYARLGILFFGHRVETRFDPFEVIRASFVFEIFEDSQPFLLKKVSMVHSFFKYIIENIFIFFI